MTSDAPHTDLLDAYRATVWEVTLPGSDGPRSIRLRIGERAGAALGECGIITGWNPRSLLRPRAENDAANRRLRARLESAGAEVASAVALDPRDPHGRWREPGFLVRGMDRDTLARIAARFGQNAIVWIGGDGRAGLVAARPGFAGRATGEVISQP